MVSYNARIWMFIVAVFSILVSDNYNTRINTTNSCKNPKCVATLLILQITTKSHHTSYQAVEILPSIQVRVEWLHLSVVLLYTTGLISASSQHIHWVRRMLIKPIWEIPIANSHTSTLYH